jgi:hypothetical protein
MDCSSNNLDDQGNPEDPITLDALDPERRLQVGRLCYSPESIADWILEKNDTTDLYGNELSDRQLLDLLHFLDGRDSDRYPHYEELSTLIANKLGIVLTFMIYLDGADYPETMTHYRTRRVATQQANHLSQMDNKLRELGVHAVTDDIRFIAPLQYFIPA